MKFLIDRGETNVRPLCDTEEVFYSDDPDDPDYPFFPIDEAVLSKKCAIVIIYTNRMDQISAQELERLVFNIK